MKKLFLVVYLVSQLSLGKNIECHVELTDFKVLPDNPTLYSEVFVIPVNEQEYSISADFVDSRINFRYIPFYAAFATLVISLDLLVNNDIGYASVFETRVNALSQDVSIFKLDSLTHPQKPFGAYEIECHQQDPVLGEPIPVDVTPIP